MIVNLMRARQMFSLTLPNKVKGRYWLTDLDESGKRRRLVDIEAVDGVWVLKGNRKVRIYGANDCETPSAVLNDSIFLRLGVEGSDEQVVLFTEPVDPTRQTLTKISVTEAAVFSVGRTAANQFAFDNRYVSGTHAKLVYDGEEWSVSDEGSRNGTYVNGLRAGNQKLQPGDCIYIMGLKIVVGKGFLAVNNPDCRLTIRSDALQVYGGQKRDPAAKRPELPEKQYFSRSPRFHREICHEEITIDPPPPPQKTDTVPLALMLGPSLTMGMTSVGTGVLAVANTMANGGQITQALPTVIMSVSMLLGTILWPLLTKKYEKREKKREEQRRQSKYLAYLNRIGDAVRAMADEQVGILNENMPGSEECMQRIAGRQSDLWERANGQTDFLRLRLGVGDLPLDAEVHCPEKKFSMEDDALQNAMLSFAETPKQLTGVPVGLSLAENLAVGLYGEKAVTENLLKALILQMAALHSYDELKIMLITEEDEAANWNFARYIPHFWNNDKTTRFFAASADDVKELSSYIEKNILTREEKNTAGYFAYTPYYVILLTSAKLSKRCEAIRNLLNYSSNVGFTLMVADERPNAFFKETRTIIHVDGERSELVDREDTSGKRVRFTAEKVNEAMLGHLAARLANIELDLNSQSYILPSMMTFLEMFGVGKVEHLNSLARWKENNPTKTLQTPVGVDEDGDLFDLDLHEKFHGPHGLVAGMTGSGKSEFIITYILSLAVNYHPDEVAFILIDYKGGGLTGAFEDPERGIKLPHLAGTITNLDGSAIQRSLISIQSELRRRQALFNEARKVSNEGTMDIYKYQQLYRDKVVDQPLPHLFIISDEFAELKMQQPEFMEQLISTARIGRSLGVHLILATQKPSGVVDDQIWSNSKFRVCLKVQDRSDSQDMIKCPDAAELSVTGRFYLQVGFNDFFALGQSAWCGAEYIPADTVEKAVDNSVTFIDDLGRTVLSVKPQAPAAAKVKHCKQVVAVVKYLSDLAAEERIAVKPLWLDPIPAVIYTEELRAKYGTAPQAYILDPVIGEYDDPFNQRQAPLTIPLSREGNCLIYGSTGSGKTTLLTTLCYTLIEDHGTDELNLYILDFGSETLRAFEKAPQVGDVITSSDEEKTVNFFKMLHREIEDRRSRFADYGGDYTGYCRRGEEPVPNIVVVLNNYSAFAEQHEALLEEFAVLTRDATKYGIFFVITTSSVNAVRYKIQQNFKTVMTMQLNDASDYVMVVGRTEGLVPAKYKGRGLVVLDRLYEFQTAYCTKAEDVGDAVRRFCESMAAASDKRAAGVPVLSETVDAAFVAPYIRTLREVPVGVAKDSLEIVTVNLAGRVVLPVVAQDAEECGGFISAFGTVLSRCVDVVRIHAETETSGPREFDAEATVLTMFREMVKRNNLYKDAGLDESVLEPFVPRVYVIFGLTRFMELLSEDGKDKLKTLLEKAEPIYKLHFVLCDSAAKLNAYAYEAWFKRQIPGSDGIWVGDGIAEQYLLKVGKVRGGMYGELGAGYGYAVAKGRPILTKLLNAAEESL